jgi:hypothetical protein
MALPCNYDLQTYLTLPLCAVRLYPNSPFLGGVKALKASGGSSLDLRFREGEPGGAEVIKTTGSSREGGMILWVCLLCFS